MNTIIPITDEPVKIVPMIDSLFLVATKDGMDLSWLHLLIPRQDYGFPTATEVQADSHVPDSEQHDSRLEIPTVH
jgi:hypothetical protein